MTKATTYLERCYDIASRNRQPLQQANACSALGLIASSQGQHEKAVTYFQQSLDIARSINDRRLIDAARINLGMAQGNVTLSSYLTPAPHIGSRSRPK